MKRGQLLEEARAWGSNRERGRKALASARLEIAYADVRGVRLRYVQSPGEGTPLLFCNGIGANLEMALPFIQAMDGVPIVAFDAPGCGGSDDAHFWPRFSNYAKFAVGLLDELGLPGRFDVAGVSWGGGLAQTIARDYADRVGRLVLMATTAGAPMLPGHASALMKMMTPQRYLSRTFMASNAAAIYGGELRRRPDLAIELARFTRALSRRAYLQQLAAISHFTAWTFLPRLRCPALVLNGDDDPLIRVMNARFLAALIPKGRLQVIPGAGHLFMLFNAAETARLIREFLAATSGAPQVALGAAVAPKVRRPQGTPGSSRGHQALESRDDIARHPRGPSRPVHHGLHPGPAGLCDDPPVP